MCEECGIRRLGRYVCEKHEMEEEQPAEEEILYRAKDREALTYQRYLAQKGVESRIFSADQDAGLVLAKDTIEAASIIVPSNYREPARRWMKSRYIEDGQVLFQCERCSALNGYSDNGCANCGGQ